MISQKETHKEILEETPEEVSGEIQEGEVSNVNAKRVLVKLPE